MRTAAVQHKKLLKKYTMLMGAHRNENLGF